MKKGIKKYKNIKASEIDKILKDNYSMVYKAASYMHAKLPSYIDIDDLIQVGLIGLYKAIENFEGKNNAKFNTYAYTKVKGAMLDEIRNSDWVPRSIQKKSKDLANSISELTKQIGREPSSTEIANFLNISIDDYYILLNEVKGYKVLSIDYENESGNGFDVVDKNQNTPEEILNKDEFKKILVDAIKSLPEREALLVSLYYEEEMSLKEIGLVVGVSESRVSQLLNQATLRIKGKMEALNVSKPE